MKDKILKHLDVFCECAGFTVISCAFLNMMSFRQSFLYVLFFAANVRLITGFCGRILKLTGSKIAVAALFAVCIFAVAVLTFFAGRAVGEFARFDF